MVRKIGSIIISCLVVTALPLKAQLKVELTATNNQGATLHEVQVGVPFYVTARVSGPSRSLPMATITDLPSEYVKDHSNSSNMSIINGVMNASLNSTYTVVIPEEGEYTFGPAVCNQGQQDYSSQKITIKAVHKDHVQVSANTAAFGTLFFSKKEVFYQEPVECIFRFYYAIDGIRLHDISEPVFKGCIAEPLGQPHTAQVERIDGVDYRYLEWKTKIYPTTTGKISIAPLRMTYTQPVRGRSRGSLFTDLFDMMGGFEQGHEIYTNSAQLSVKPLPSGAENVQAVGDFTSYTLSCTTDTVSAGEALVVTTKIEGEGNLYSLSHPPLQVPPYCTVYEGNASYDPTKKPSSKTFEYVVQARQPGTYSISAQVLTYFDLATGTYKKLETQPLTFTVTQNTSASPSNVPDVQDVSETSSSDKEWQPSFTNKGPWRAVKAYHIPWIYFFIATFVIAASGVGVVVVRAYKKRYHKRAAQRRYEMAFRTARKQLELARKRKYYGHVYSVFMHMFAERLRVDVKTLTEYSIEDRIKDHLTQAQLVQWRLFYVMMSEAAFAHNTQESDTIFTQAFGWLHNFERML